jgi:F-type H+-transporting ATPase subunit epsilon
MTLDVHVVTPEREVWSGQATQVIARGVDGEVGILTGHAPLLIQLAVGPLRIEQVGGGWLTAVADGGFMHVTSGEEGTRVDVMAAAAELASEIDLEAARRRRDELASSAEDDDTAKAELAKAEARIAIAG